jgi:hypothetical protein
MLPLRFGKGNVGWQARINFDERVFEFSTCSPLAANFVKVE